MSEQLSVRKGKQTEVRDEERERRAFSPLHSLLIPSYLSTIIHICKELSKLEKKLR
jgi:hypothetical protein